MFFYDHEMSLGHLVHYVLNFMHIKQSHNDKYLTRIIFSTNCFSVSDILNNIKSRVRFFSTTSVIIRSFSLFSKTITVLKEKNVLL